MSKLEQAFTVQAKLAKLPKFETEYRFARDIVGHGVGIRSRLKEAGLQDWRFDFYWPIHRVAVELNGGTFINGRHNRGAALTSEYRKLNTASEHGITVLVFDSGMVKTGEALNQVERLLNSIGGQS